MGQACRGHLPALTPPADPCRAPHPESEAPLPREAPPLTSLLFSFAAPPRSRPAGETSCLSEAPGRRERPALMPCGGAAGRSRLTRYMLHSQGGLRAWGPRGLLLCLSHGTCQRDRVAPESAWAPGRAPRESAEPRRGKRAGEGEDGKRGLARGWAVDQPAAGCQGTHGANPAGAAPWKGPLGDRTRGRLRRVLP